MIGGSMIFRQESHELRVYDSEHPMFPNCDDGVLGLLTLGVAKPSRAEDLWRSPTGDGGLRPGCFAGCQRWICDANQWSPQPKNHFG